MPPFWVGLSKQRKKPGWRRSSNCVKNAFFQLSPSGGNEKTPLGSNFTISVLCHHFRWAYPSSGKSRVHEGRPIAFKTRFFNFPHRSERKKHPWDRILQFRFHATILGGLIQAAEKAGLTKIVQLRSKRVFSSFPFRAKRKNTLGIEFYNFGFMAPFWVGLSKQQKKPRWRMSTNCVLNAFFQLSPSRRNEKQPWDRILQFRFYAIIFGGLFQAAEKAGLTKVVQLRSKQVFSTFPIGAKRKSTFGIEFYNFGFIAPFWVGLSKQRKKPGSRRSTNCVQNAFFNFPHRGETKKQAWDGILQFRFYATILGGIFQGAKKTPCWRRSSNCVENAFFQLSPSRRNEKTPLGSNFTISVSCHHFGWAFPSSGKSRVYKVRPIAFKTRFLNFPYRVETKKKPLGSILQFRFRATILKGLFQAAEKAGWTKVVQLRSKRVFSTFPILARQKKNSRGIKFYNFGFMPPFWVGFSKQRKKPGLRRSSNCVQNTFLNFPYRVETKKKTLGIEIYNFGFMPPFWVGLSKQRKKPGLRRSFNCVQNTFLNFPYRVETKKKPLGSKFKISVSCHHFGWAFPISGKSRVDQGRPIAFKTRFLNFPYRVETKKNPWDRFYNFGPISDWGLYNFGLVNSLGIEIYNFGFMPPFWVGFSKQRKKPGWRRSSNCVQNAFFQLFPSSPDKKNSRGIKFYKFSFMPPFWVRFSKQRKKPGWRRSSNCVPNAFFQLSPSGRNEKRPLGSNFTISVSCHHFGWAFPSSGKNRVHEGRPIAFKTRFFNFPHRGETKKHHRDRILQFRFPATILGGLFQAAEKAGLTKVVQLRSKRVFWTFPIGEKRKNTLGIEFYNFGWVFRSSGRSRVYEGRPRAFKMRFFNFPRRGETKKHPWDRILQFRFHATILGGLF